jgi:hypothetical protein
MVTNDHQAVESTRFPNGEVACILVENDCRKLARLADPPLPPKSFMSVSKLVCNELAAVPVAVVLAVLVAVPVEVPVDVPVTDWIKLFTSVAKCVPWAPRPGAASGADVVLCD